MRQTSPDSRDRNSSGKLSLTTEGLAWLAVAVVLGVVGWVKTINLVLALAYLMLALLVLNGIWVRLQVGRVTVAREPDPPPFAQEVATVRLTAKNTGRRSATVNVEDHVGENPTSWLVHRLAAFASVDCVVRRIFATRGRYPAALQIASGFPLGLVRFERRVAGSDFVVLPARGEVDADGLRAWTLRQAGGDGRARKVLRRVTSEQADVRGVRPYRPGDPIRGIHWRSSARRGALMVREYDAAPSPDLVLVVEPWLPSKRSAGDLAKLESALSLAVAIAWTWSHSFGSRVTVVVAGNDALPATATLTDSTLRTALSPLAGVKGAESFDAPEPGTFDRMLSRSARIVVSSRPHTPYAALLAHTTGRPFLALCPADRPSWYHPPKPAALLLLESSPVRSHAH